MYVAYVCTYTHHIACSILLLLYIMPPAVPTNSSGHVNGKTNATAPTATNQNCSHRVRPHFSPSSSLDIEDSMQ